MSSSKRVVSEKVLAFLSHNLASEYFVRYRDQRQFVKESGNYLYLVELHFDYISDFLTITLHVGIRSIEIESKLDSIYNRKSPIDEATIGKNVIDSGIRQWNVYLVNPDEDLVRTVNELVAVVQHTQLTFFSTHSNLYMIIHYLINNFSSPVQCQKMLVAAAILNDRPMFIQIYELTKSRFENLASIPTRNIHTSNGYHDFLRIYDILINELT